MSTMQIYLSYMDPLKLGDRLDKGDGGSTARSLLPMDLRVRDSSAGTHLCHWSAR